MQTTAGKKRRQLAAEQQEFLRRRAERKIDYAALPVETPCYILDFDLLKLNAEFIAAIARAANVKVLLALKAFASFSAFPTMRDFFSGCCASSLDEARLGAEKFGGEIHVFSPAYREKEVAEYRQYASHFSFNSVAQFLQFKDAFSGKSLGLRVNPEHREVETEIYDPCRRGSRLGIVSQNLRDLNFGDGENFPEVEGLHFHNLCECNADAFARTAAVIEQKFGDILPRMKWLNCGGGHHLTRSDYDVILLAETLAKWQEKYRAEIYLEPGEACALNAGFFVVEVIDTFRNDGDIAIIDGSAATHLPDVLEMPYRPQIIGAGMPNEKRFTYRLGGPSCLAGDEIGAYSFDQEIARGQRLTFTDMAHYSIVKNNTFNGIRLPSIYAFANGETRLIKKFSYQDFVERLS